MKKLMTAFAMGVCFLLTACNSAPKTEPAVPETAPVPVVPAVTEAPAVPETETETVPVVSSSPEAILGIWKNDSGYLWFRPDGSYAMMNRLGVFPDEIGIEVTDTSLTLNVSGEILSLTQAGTHVFDTLDGLYDTAGQSYQVLIVGNTAFTYTDTGLTYSYNGETLMLQDVQTPCQISGDTMQYQGTAMTKTNELDDFLSTTNQTTGGN